MSLAGKHHASAQVGPGEISPAMRGFSLVEILVVVAILGIGALLGSAIFSSSMKRQTNMAAGNDLKITAQRPIIEMQNRNRMTFLRIAPKLAVDPKYPNTGQTPIQVFADSNGNSQLDVATDTRVQTYLLSSQIDLTSPAPTGVAGATAWDQWVAVAADDHYLGCDFQGRAFNPVTGAQILRPAILQSLHRDMTANKLTPKIAFTVSISPVWNAGLSQKKLP